MLSEQSQTSEKFRRLEQFAPAQAGQLPLGQLMKDQQFALDSVSRLPSGSKVLSFLTPEICAK
jgi:hypothetical protein